jgi:hypothetical protein
VEARLQQRALVVLLAAQGWQNKDIAVGVGLDPRQGALWRQRFLGAASLCFESKRRARRCPTICCLPRKASTTISTCSA